jgi:hypothetical protein
VINEDRIAGLHLPDGPQRLRIRHSVPDGFAVALQLRDRIGLGIRLCEKKVTRWQSCVPLFTEVYSLPGFTLLRS